MKEFNNFAAQGDVYFRRISKLPEGIKETALENGSVVVAHSESGHSHICAVDVLESKPNVRLYSGNNPLIAWMEVNRPTALEHQRPFDTHEPILFSPGIYEVRRQREHTPEGFRQVQD